jgi:hypothetical protein
VGRYAQLAVCGHIITHATNTDVQVAKHHVAVTTSIFVQHLDQTRL